MGSGRAHKKGGEKRMKKDAELPDSDHVSTSAAATYSSGRREQMFETTNESQSGSSSASSQNSKSSELQSHLDSSEVTPRSTATSPPKVFQLTCHQMRVRGQVEGTYRAPFMQPSVIDLQDMKAEEYTSKRDENQNDDALLSYIDTARKLQVLTRNVSSEDQNVDSTLLKSREVGKVVLENDADQVDEDKEVSKIVGACPSGDPDNPFITHWDSDNSERTTPPIIPLSTHRRIRQRDSKVSRWLRDHANRRFGDPDTSWGNRHRGDNFSGSRSHCRVPTSGNLRHYRDPSSRNRHRRDSSPGNRRHRRDTSSGNRPRRDFSPASRCHRRHPRNSSPGSSRHRRDPSSGTLHRRDASLESRRRDPSSGTLHRRDASLESRRRDPSSGTLHRRDASLESRRRDPSSGTLHRRDASLESRRRDPSSGNLHRRDASSGNGRHRGPRYGPSRSHSRRGQSGRLK